MDLQPYNVFEHVHVDSYVHSDSLIGDLVFVIELEQIITRHILLV